MSPENASSSKIALREKAANLKAELLKLSVALEEIRLRVEKYAAEAGEFEALLYEGHRAEYALLKDWLTEHAPDLSQLPPAPAPEEAKRSPLQRFLDTFK